MARRLSLTSATGCLRAIRDLAPPQLCGIEDDVPFDDALEVRGIRSLTGLTGIAEAPSSGDQTPR
jgi:hypothetical protein